MRDGTVIELGKHRLRFLETPHVHHWDSMMVFEETTGSLFPADLFIQPGEQPPVVRENLGKEMCELYRERRHLRGRQAGARLRRRIEKLEPDWVHPMHGGSMRSETLRATRPPCAATPSPTTACCSAARCRRERSIALPRTQGEDWGGGFLVIRITVFNPCFRRHGLKTRDTKVPFLPSLALHHVLQSIPSASAISSAMWRDALLHAAAGGTCRRCSSCSRRRCRPSRRRRSRRCS